MYVTLRDRPGGEAGQAARAAMPRIATTVVLLGIVSLLTDVSSEMVNAVLPLYLTTQVGLGMIAYGFIDGLYQGVSAFVRIAGGAAADRGHHPKWVAVVGYGVSAISRLAMLPAHGLATITAVITADRLGKGLRTAPRDALIADASEPAALGRSFGVHRALDTVGAAIGPLVAFALLAAIPTGYNSVFVISFVFALIGFAVLILLVPNRRTGSIGTKIGISQIGRQLTAPALRRPLIAATLLGLFTVGDGFLYLSLQQRDNVAAVLFPLLYVGTNVAYLSLAVPFGRIADRIGRARVFLAGHLALLLVYLIAGGPFPGIAATLLVLALLGVYYAATDGVLAALASAATPAATRGTGIAAVQTVVVIARFASSLLFGVVWVWVGRERAPLLGALALVVALAVATALFWPQLRRPSAPGSQAASKVTAS